MNIILFLRSGNVQVGCIDISNSEFVFDTIKRVKRMFNVPDNIKLQLRVVKTGIVMPENDELRLHVSDGEVVNIEHYVSPSLLPIKSPSQV